MAFNPLNDCLDKSIVVFLTISDKEKQTAFEAHLRQQLTNAHIVTFEDGPSLISEIQNWTRRPDMIFFHYPLVEA